MKAKTRVAALAIALLGTSEAGTAYAHHSFASYDMAHSLTVQATVKQFRWGAPHSSIVLLTKSPKGKTVELNLVTAPPNVFARQGVKPKSVRTGDKVEVSYHPNINGSAGGALSTMTLPDGRVFKDQESFGAQPTAAPSSPPR